MHSRLVYHLGRRSSDGRRGAGKDRTTKGGIDENGNFSVNIPSEYNVVVADYCGITLGRGSDKSKVFRVSYGTLRTAPWPMNSQ